MENGKLYRGALENIIFQLLNANHRMYGYEICKIIKVQTNNNWTISESNLYPILHKLEAEGMLETEVESTGRHLRKYYKLTGVGVKESKIKLKELNDFISSLRNFTKPIQI